MRVITTKIAEAHREFFVSLDEIIELHSHTIFVDFIRQIWPIRKLELLYG
jgi:hypothetical protein